MKNSREIFHSTTKPWDSTRFQAHIITFLNGRIFLPCLGALQWNFSSLRAISVPCYFLFWLYDLILISSRNALLEKIELSCANCLHWLFFWKPTGFITLQSVMNAKLSKHRFWHCHENGLIKTIQTIPNNLYASFKSASLYSGLG